MWTGTWGVADRSFKTALVGHTQSPGRNGNGTSNTLSLYWLFFDQDILSTQPLSYSLKSDLLITLLSSYDVALLTLTFDTRNKPKKHAKMAAHMQHSFGWLKLNRSCILRKIDRSTGNLYAGPECLTRLIPDNTEDNAQLSFSGFAIPISRWTILTIFKYCWTVENLYSLPRKAT